MIVAYLTQKLLSLSRDRYYPLGSEKLLSSDIEGSKENDFQGLELKPQSHGLSQLLLTVSLLFFMTLSILLTGAYIFKTPSNAQCGNQVTAWSPLNEVVEYEEVDFVNPFAHQTIYRGPPTPELEKAWEELWFYGGVRIPEDKLPLLNRTADLGNGVTLRPVGDEEGGFHGLIEVFHQLHCLNLIRQFTWHDWYFRHPDVVKTPGDLQAGAVGNRMHVDHCIEALRISLMCHGDTTPYLIMMDPTAPQGMRADFSPHHKCRNFENLRSYMKEHQLGAPLPMHHEPMQH